MPLKMSYVLVPLLHNVQCVLARSRKIHLFEKSRAVRLSVAFVPTEHVRTAGVVISERIRYRIIGLVVTLKQLRQIETAAEYVRFRIEDSFMRERAHPLRVCPFKGRVLPHLHQPDFSRLTTRPRLEPALLPNHRLDQRRIDCIASRRSQNLAIVPHFRPLTEPPPEQHAKRSQTENCGNE